METTSPTTKLNTEIIGENSRHQNCDIPEEIVTDIISRLRVKPVFQLQCLSNNFSSIAYDQSFIDAHLKQSTRLRPSIIVNRDQFPKYQKLKISMIQCNAIDSEITVETLPTPHNMIWPCLWGDKIEIVGSCNGLIILFLNNEYCIIWNPATMQCIGLPLPSKVPYNYETMTSWGFGYCAESRVYKIVKILCMIPDLNSISFFLDGDIIPDRKYMAEVFIYGKDRAWRSLDLSKFDHKISCDGNGVTVNGSVYWIMDGEEHVNKLLTFDMEKEKFAWIFRPASKEGKVMEFRGLLALSVQSIINENSFDLWVLNDEDKCDALNKNSWEKIYTIDEIYPCKPIQCLNYRQLLLLNRTATLFGYSWSLYDLESKEIREIPEVFICCEDEVHNFVESIVPLFASRRFWPYWI